MTKEIVQGSSHPPKLTIRTQCGKFPVTLVDGVVWNLSL